MVQRKIKWLRYTGLLSIVFALGILLPEIFVILGFLVFRSTDRDIFRYFKPVVFSETQIKKAIEQRVPITIPAEATNLYYAWEGVIDIDLYVALTLPSRECCDEFLKEQLRTPIENFKETEWSLGDLSHDNPSRWPEKFKGNWDLKASADCPLYFCRCKDPGGRGDGGAVIYYFPDHCRIFLIVDSPFAFNLFMGKGDE